MKKGLTLLFAALLLFCLVFTASAEAEKTGFGKIDLNRGSIKLDGLMDDAYEEYGKVFRPSVYKRVRNSARTDYYADFYCLFSENYTKLNVFIHVVDPTTLVPTDANHDAWNHIVHTDCVELWIDPTNACTVAGNNDSINGEAYHYRIDASGFVTGSFWGIGGMGNEACLPYVTSAMVYTDVGYDFELVINCQDFVDRELSTLERGNKWGFQLMTMNVYDELHYEYEKEGSPHRWETSYYYANMFALPCSTVQGFSIEPVNFDYIVLGNEVGEPDCEHDIVDHEGQEATCTEDGWKPYQTCTKCDYTTYEAIEKLGHQPQDIPDADPTCTAVGHIGGQQCERCGEILDPPYELAKLRHEYEDGICLMCGAAQNPFEDVKAKDWFCDAVLFCYDRELFAGITATKFAPNDPMTRSMLVTVLWRLEGSPVVNAVNPFTDVKKGWYYNAVLWGSSTDVVAGTGGGKFSPDLFVTREQIASILYRYASTKPIFSENENDLSAYPDASDVSKWAKEAIGWAVTEGLINGIPAGDVNYLKPLAHASRAQVAQILNTFCYNFMN